MTRLASGLVVAVALVVSACDPPPAPTDRAPAMRPSLAATLLAASDAAADAGATIVEGWRLDRAAWTHLVVEPYRSTYDDYVRAFDAAAPAWRAVLARGGEVTTRAHYAGDPRLTLGQARARWALPVQFPSEVAEVGGAPLDGVFVRVGDDWRVVVGIDAIIAARARVLDPTCAAYVASLQPGRCGDVGWVLADAALRGDRPRFEHACRLASNLCPK